MKPVTHDLIVFNADVIWRAVSFGPRARVPTSNPLGLLLYPVIRSVARAEPQ